MVPKIAREMEYKGGAVGLGMYGYETTVGHQDYKFSAPIVTLLSNILRVVHINEAWRVSVVHDNPQDRGAVARVMNLAPLTTAGQTLPCSRWATVIEVDSGPVVASKRGSLTIKGLVAIRIDAA
mgnify:CR=1 FL=1